MPESQNFRAEVEESLEGVRAFGIKLNIHEPASEEAEEIEELDHYYSIQEDLL